MRNPIADTGMLALRRCHSDTEVALARLPIAIRLATSGKRYDSVDSSTRYGLFVSLVIQGILKRSSAFQASALVPAFLLAI